MAITLASASTGDKLDFGDVALGTYTNGISIALTVKPSGSFGVSDVWFAGQWGNTSSEQCWAITTTDTDELGWAVQGFNGTVRYWTVKTTSLNLAASTLYRIVCTHSTQSGGGQVSHIYVNGTDMSVVDWFGQSSVLNTLQDSANPVYVGYMASRSIAGTNGDYSEFAMWNYALHSETATAISNGFSPGFFKTGRPSGASGTGLVYAPLINTGALRDVWGGVSPTNTNGTTASHPSVYTPKSAQAFRRDTAAAAATGSDWLRLALQGA